MSPLDHSPQRVTLAFTGASGMPYGLRLLECLLQADRTVWLLISQAAHVVASHECDAILPAQPRAAQATLSARYGAKPGQLQVFGREDWLAPVASGSNAADAMVVCPCSMGTLAAIAQGLADNLIERAADVMLKEHRPLVLVPRETPLSTIHLENMLRLSRAGAVIVPPAPGFYTRPQSVADMVDFVVARILDQLHVPNTLTPRWAMIVPRSLGATRSADRIVYRRGPQPIGEASDLSAQDRPLSGWTSAAARIRNAVHGHGQGLPQG